MILFQKVTNDILDSTDNIFYDIVWNPLQLTRKDTYMTYEICITKKEKTEEKSDINYEGLRFRFRKYDVKKAKFICFRRRDFYTKLI